MSHERLNTVAAVVLIIWMGLAVHLWRLTRRIEKLEKGLSGDAPESS